MNLGIFMTLGRGRLPQAGSEFVPGSGPAQQPSRVATSSTKRVYWPKSPSREVDRELAVGKWGSQPSVGTRKAGGLEKCVERWPCCRAPRRLEEAQNSSLVRGPPGSGCTAKSAGLATEGRPPGSHQPWIGPDLQVPSGKRTGPVRCHHRSSAARWAARKHLRRSSAPSLCVRSQLAMTGSRPRLIACVLGRATRCHRLTPFAPRTWLTSTLGCGAVRRCLADRRPSSGTRHGGRVGPINRPQ
jgi:hypothetical protein